MNDFSVRFFNDNKLTLKSRNGYNIENPEIVDGVLWVDCVPENKDDYQDRVIWREVGDRSPDGGRRVEVVGHYTFCCEHDAQHWITIRECIYDDDQETYKCEEGGYMILPFYWRYLK